VSVLAHLPGFLATMATLVSISFIDKTFGPLIPLYVQQLHAPERFRHALRSRAARFPRARVSAISRVVRLVRRYSRDEFNRGS